jgi:uncharacterized protein HemX
VEGISMNKRARDVIVKAKDHVLKKKDFAIPTWAIYAIVAVSVVFLIFGGIQQLRIWRWQKLMVAAKNRIIEFDAQKSIEQLKENKKNFEKSIAPDKKKISSIDVKIRKLESKRKNILKETKKVSNKELLDLFKSEGF